MSRAASGPYICTSKQHDIKVAYICCGLVLLSLQSRQRDFDPTQVLLSVVKADWICLILQIATVDKYQGQQNDYILLSLVRTRAVGHIRDVRRLVVAMSRARLGLYIFGRAELFANCYELRPAMKQLLDRPQQLHLHTSERLAVSNAGHC